jgi:hypothetical protein
VNVNASDRRQAPINGDGCAEMPGQEPGGDGRRIWSWNGRAWHLVLDTTPPDDGSDEDMRQKFAEAGYLFMGRYGDEHGSFCAELFQHQDREGGYLLLLTVCDVVETVKVESFPALLALMKELCPLFQEGRLES